MCFIAETASHVRVYWISQSRQPSDKEGILVAFQQDVDRVNSIFCMLLLPLMDFVWHIHSLASLHCVYLCSGIISK